MERAMNDRTRQHFQRERLIRFSDCDPAGIVFYPQYFVMFNGLVEDWFDEALGLPYADVLMRRRIGLPTVRVEAEFRAVSRLGDRVALSLGVERLGGRSLALELRCTSAGATAAATADSAGAATAGAAASELRMSMRQVIVTTSLDTHRAVDIPADLRAAIAHDAGIPQ
jgi:4-hydroxybenzoyl-CoA thioesterase